MLKTTLCVLLFIAVLIAAFIAGVLGSAAFFGWERADIGAIACGIIATTVIGLAEMVIFGSALAKKG